MNISKEVTIIRELLSITQEELAKEIGVAYETINRWENDKNEIEMNNVNKLYNYAFKKKVYINSIYEQLYLEEYQAKERKVLFHGCKKSGITFPLDLGYSKVNNDFGVGFYLGETYNQAASYIANGNSPFVYVFHLDTNELNITHFAVNREWMIAIAYFRGWLNEYKNNNYVKKIIEKVNNSDVIIAPIADNRMFDIISEFVRGEITDLQCEHALAATNLGMQYVLKTTNSLERLEFIKVLYVSDLEKDKIIDQRLKMSNLSQDKVRVARIEYRSKGKYIDEVLK